MKKKLPPISFSMKGYLRVDAPDNQTFFNFLNVNMGKESCRIDKAEAIILRDYLTQEIKKKP